MKRIIIFFFVIINIFALSAYSMEFEDTKGKDCQEAVEFLSAYGVINGYSQGVFGPGEYITRGQMSKIVSIILGIYDYPQNSESEFTDMEGHWSNSYVQAVSGLGMIKGYEDGTFRPDEVVTYPEALTFILRTLGYTDESLTGEWPYDYLVKAGDIDLLDGIEMNGQGANRGDIALMTYNALFKKNGMIDSESELWKSDGKILLGNIGYMKEGQITKDMLKERNTYSKLSDYLFYTGNIFYNNDDEIVYFKNINTEKFTGRAIDLDKDRIIVENEDGNTRTFNIIGSEILYNNFEGNLDSILDINVDVIYQKTEGDEIIADALVGRELSKHFIATYPYERGETYNDIILPMNEGNADAENIHVYGAVDSLYAIKADDVVFVYETDEAGAKTFLELFITRNKIQGNMTYVKNNTAEGFSVINGVRYDHSQYYIPSEIFETGYYVEGLLDEYNDLVRHKYIQKSERTDLYGFVTAVSHGDGDHLPTVTVMKSGGREVTLNIKLENDIIIETGGFDNISYNVNLQEGNVINYTLENIDTVDEIKEIDLEELSGRYRHYDNILLPQEAFLDINTIIIYKDDGRWVNISSDKLEESIEGQIARGEKSHYVEVLIVKNGIKTKYPEMVYGVLSNAAKVRNSYGELVYRLDMNIEGKLQTVYSNSDVANLSDIQDYEGKLVKFIFEYDRVVSYETLTPELDFAGPVIIYDNNLIKIGQSFYEIEGKVIAYKAYLIDGSYLISDIIELSEIREDDTLRLYDIKGNNDGIIDTVIVLGKIQ